MRITDLKAIPVSLDIKPAEEKYGIAPYMTSVGKKEATHRTLIKVETDAGITGWGETSTFLSPTVTKTVLEEGIAPSLRGHDLQESRDIKEVFYDPFIHIYYDIAPLLGGIEIAFWDAWAKSLDIPLYQLFGGKYRDQVPYSYCVGAIPPANSTHHVERALELGCETIKVKGTENWREDVKRIRTMHKEAPSDIEFRLDPNQAWSIEDTVRVGALLEDAGIYLQYLEQPIRINSPDSYANLRKRLRQPIGVNEDTYQNYNLYNLIKQDAIDVGVVDFVPLGGYSALDDLVGTASDAGISLAHHSGFELGIKTAAIAHYVAATPALNLATDTAYFALEDDVLADPLEFSDGGISVPTEPGLGVSIDPTKIEKHRILGQ